MRALLSQNPNARGGDGELDEILAPFLAISARKFPVDCEFFAPKPAIDESVVMPA